MPNPTFNAADDSNPAHTIELAVDDPNQPRLDKWLTEALTAQGMCASRERVGQLIESGAVTLNGKVSRKPAHRVSHGDPVTCQWPAMVPLDLAAQDLKVPVVYEDEALLVVNKPVGMLTHPTGANQTDTLVNALLYHCRGQLSGINGVIRPGIVHRLDRDTAGLLVVAKTNEAHHHLAAQLNQKTMRRSYRAVVQGELSADTGTYTWPIARNPNHRQAMRVDPEGRHAITHWSVASRLMGRFCAVNCELETGRTHQIRVHFAKAGHPLVGDVLYGSGLAQAWDLACDGQLLQAWRLSLMHPTTGKAMTFELPVAPHLLSVWQALACKTSGLPDCVLDDPWAPPAETTSTIGWQPGKK
jgi:23S rRNA pseudouridine1911/1915/1917 synthase